MRIIAILSTVILLAAVFYTQDVSRVTAFFLQISWIQICAIALLLFANLFFSCVRFHLLLRRFGARLNFWATLRANTLAQVTSVFLLPIFGHIVGRAAFLKQHSLPASVIASITVYEKVVTLASSSLLCIAGLWYLYGDEAQTYINSVLVNVHVVHIAAIIVASLILSYKIGALRLERALWSRILSFRSIVTTAEAGFVTLMAHGCMIGAYSVVLAALPHKISLAESVSASSIIMFLAGLPISLSGWGIRELASVHFLGDLGVPAADALAASIFIGLAALGCLMAAGVLASAYSRRNKSIEAKATESIAGLKHDKAIVAVLSGLTSAGLFFQFHVPVKDTVIAINVADPLALTGAALFLIHLVREKKLPSWRYHAGKIMSAITLTIAFAFCVGYFSFGVTDWALNNRLIGWLVILAYLFSGASTASFWGNNGARRIFESLAIAGCLVSLYLLISAQLNVFGLIEVQKQFLPPFSEMSPNRNALAFELLIALAGALTLYSVSKKKSKKGWGWPLGISLLSTGVILTSSRAGMGTLAILLIFAITKQLISLKTTAAIVFVVPTLIFGPSLTVGSQLHLVATPQSMLAISEASSNTERIKSIKDGLALWRNSPIFGAGLGAYLHSQEGNGKAPLVIHSTPIWLLAEFGIFGFIIFFAGSLLLLRKGLQQLNTSSQALTARALVLGLITFFVFCSVHEILYQRIFWLFLGTCLCTGGKNDSQSTLNRVPIGHNVQCTVPDLHTA